MMKQKAVSAMIWSVVGQIGSTGLSTVFVLIFARFMPPSDFGAFALGAMVTGLASHLAGLGLGTALVQRHTLDERTLSTAFWMVLAASTVLAVGLVGLSRPFALLFKDPRVAEIIAPLAFAMVISSMTTILTSTLRRDLDMKSLAIRTLVPNLLAGSLALPLALAGFGTVALVTQAVLGAVFSLIAAVLLTGCPIRMQFDRVAAKDMLTFSIPVMKSDFLLILNMESPKLFIGLLLGTYSLGIYSMAARLLNMLLMVLGTTMSSVAFPLLSHVHRNERSRIYEVYLRLFRLAGTVYVPAFLLCAVLSEDLISIALGSKWISAAPVTAILCLAGIPLGLHYVNGATAMAIGDSHLRYRVTLFGALIGTLLLATAAPFGLIWVGAALLARSLITETLMTRGVFQALGGRFPRDLSVLRSAAVGGMVLLAFTGPARLVLAETPAVMNVAVVSTVAFSAYAVYIWLMDRDIISELLNLAKNRALS